MKYQNTAPVFDYRAQRLMIGVIALSIPFVVTIIAGTSLPSISDSYHSPARDWLVGLLCVVGALMWTYNGHSRRESIASKLAGLSAVVVALFPTAQEPGTGGWVSSVHFSAAAFLFAILAYFCLGPFRAKTRGQAGKKGRRAKLYLACGVVIIVCMAVGGVSKIPALAPMFEGWDVIYWIETIGLLAFGAAWIVSGKIIPLLVDEEDALKVFRG